MSGDYRYHLIVVDNDTEGVVVEIQAPTEEMLLEKLGHVDSTINIYEDEKEREKQFKTDLSPETLEELNN